MNMIPFVIMKYLADHDEFFTYNSQAALIELKRQIIPNLPTFNETILCNNGFVLMEIGFPFAIFPYAHPDIFPLLNELNSICEDGTFYLDDEGFPTYREKVYEAIFTDCEYPNSRADDLAEYVYNKGEKIVKKYYSLFVDLIQGKGVDEICLDNHCNDCDLDDLSDE